MRRSRILGLAVVFVALALTMNALAFRTASVSSSATFSVVTSGSAALAVTNAGSPDPGIGTDETGGVFTLTINDKVQPNSEYRFANVMTVKNGTGRTTSIKDLSYSISGLTAAEGVVKLYLAGTSTEFPGTVSDGSYTLEKDEAVVLDLFIDLTKDAVIGSKPLTITISGAE